MTASASDERRPLLDENAPEDAGKPKVNLLAVFIPMTLGIFLAAVDQTIVVASYAAIGSDLKELQKTSWIATSYMLTLTSFQPLYGKLSDIFGRKACLLTAYCIFCVGSVLCGLSRTMDELIYSRALTGVGGGGMSTVVSIIMSDVVPLRERGTWQGILNIVFATGSGVGAPLGGLLADTIGWRWAFLLQAPIALLAIVSVSIALHMPTVDTTDFSTKIKRVDFAGAFTLVATLFFFLFGVERGGNVAWDDKQTIGALIIAAVAFVLFGFIEMEWAREPLAPKRIIVNRSLIASYLCNFFCIAAMMPILFYVSLYVQAVQGASPSRAGLFFIPSVAAGVAGSLLGGLYIQSRGIYYTLTVLAYGLQVAGTIVVVLGSGLVFTGLGILIPGLVAASLGNGTGITTSLISLIANAGAADQAIATAVSYLFRSLGSVLGLSIGSTLVQTTLRGALRAKLDGRDVDEIIANVRHSLTYIKTLPPDVAHAVRASYEEAIQACFLFALGMAFCAFSASWFIREVPLGKAAVERREEEQTQ
ncbi:MFS general substrate transporter [Cylindrobasidium torrendii FP15055 ss-10]|uniref:MFS general substrate transporter n=1 Tax=Cylindrobasidium torrendii FP15055 ss-10 TaxID=1314674 RepID=A0A0D7B389_9AGAR|nr:MFS general substrate transporter [Cylindrobasidium torrendii FP15055 ss-10]